jgi:Uma2 family endonuclease
MAERSPRTSVEAYLEAERTSDSKHEYFDGLVIAMAGASPRHNMISTNVIRRLSAALDDGPCRVFGSDQRVHVEATRSYVYPDVSVACGPLDFTSERPASLRNPTLLVEVLSPTTEDHDRGAKLAHYRRTPSVREVLLLQANEQRGELYRRQSDGTWLIVDVVADEIVLESIGVRVPLAACYAKTEGLPLDPPRGLGD